MCISPQKLHYARLLTGCDRTEFATLAHLHPGSVSRVENSTEPASDYMMFRWGEATRGLTEQFYMSTTPLKELGWWTILGETPIPAGLDGKAEIMGKNLAAEYAASYFPTIPTVEKFEWHAHQNVPVEEMLEHVGLVPYIAQPTAHMAQHSSPTVAVDTHRGTPLLVVSGNVSSRAEYDTLLAYGAAAYMTKPQTMYQQQALYRKVVESRIDAQGGISSSDVGALAEFSLAHSVSPMGVTYWAVAHGMVSPDDAGHLALDVQNIVRENTSKLELHKLTRAFYTPHDDWGFSLFPAVKQEPEAPRMMQQH